MIFFRWLLFLSLSCRIIPGQAPPVVKTTVTVTADRTATLDLRSAPEVVTARDREEFQDRPLVTIGDIFRGEPGILVQNTTPAQVSPFLRGLTGYQVLNLVDGVRFNNATFRSGPNQYLALIEPSTARVVEAVLGPSAAEFGSDALGGVIHVLTPAARYQSGQRRETHGLFELGAATGDWSGRGSGQFQLSGNRFSWIAGGSGLRVGDLRAGQGIDSRNVLRRLLGLNNGQIGDIIGTRLDETGFAQGGGHTKFSLRPTARSTVSLWYQHSTQAGVNNYKDLWGGLGRLQSAVTPQSVDLLYARGERTDWLGLDSLSGTFSLNRQRDGTRQQNLRAADAVTEDHIAVSAFGYTAQGRATLWQRMLTAFGGEFYDEHIDARRTVALQPVRPLYPDDSRYRTLGLFIQNSAELFSNRVRVAGGLRYTGIGYRTANGAFGVAASDRNFSDFTGNFSATWQVLPGFGFQFLTGRGFRAPNANDMGAVGLNDLGYEVPATEAVQAGALLSASAGEGATKTGPALTNLRAESLWNYEAGMRWQVSKLYARVQGFWADLRDPIVRRTLLFDSSAIPAAVGGLSVTPIAPTAAQRAQGVVTVASSLDPRALKSFVNDGQARYYGMEALAEWKGTRWTIRGDYNYIVGRDLNPNRNARRLPPQQGAVRVRHHSRWRGLWIETVAFASGAQRRLSGGDLDDERIGGSRARRDIAAFFSGALLAPHVVDGRFLGTGETLLQIQNRVLPGLDDTTRVPLYSSTAGYLTFDARAGLPLADRLTLTAGVLNLADRNYRVHGSGTDGMGRSLFAGLRYQF